MRTVPMKSMDDEREWRFDIDDVGTENEDEVEANGGYNDEIARLRSADPEPGSPSAENAAFVALGAIVTVTVLLLLLGVL